MMMTQEADLGNLIELAEGLEAFVQQAAEEGFAAHEVEREIWQRVLAMGRQAMGRFFDTQGEGDVGDSIEMPDGQQWQRLDEPHRRLYQSIFGPFELERVVYGTREGQKIELVPLDARLELPQSEFSYVLQNWAQSLDVDHAFARTAETLQMIFGLDLSVDSLERMCRKMAESVEGFRTSLKKPPVKEEGKILVTTADGKGIPMRRPSDQRPAGARRKKGEKANKKQMATIGCVYTVDPKVRTPEEVVADPADGFVARTLGFKNVLRGVVLSDGEILEIECSVGVLSVAKPPDLKTAKGAELMLLIDEKGIAMSDFPSGEAAASDSLQGVITERVFRGDGYELRVQVGQGELYCHASADAVTDLVRSGQHLTVVINPTAIRFLRGEKQRVCDGGTGTPLGKSEQ